MHQHRLNIDALNIINSNIARHSPHPHKVQVVAVTKNFNYTAIHSAIQNKLTCIGENRVHEFLSKTPHLSPDHKIEPHLIGHLQRNKTIKALKVFDVIETVDSIKLAHDIHKKADTINKKQKIYIQINIGQDPKKYGFLPNAIYSQIEKIMLLSNISIRGVMTILPFLSNPKDTQPLFNKMYKIQTKIQSELAPQCTALSMGMSRDYIYALKEGATHLRLGTILYGKR